MTVSLSQIQIEKPLSDDLYSDNWDIGVLGKLARQTQNNVFLREVPFDVVGRADAVWRVVHAFWSPEDTTMTRFWTYGIDGAHLPYMPVGVHYEGLPSDRRISGRFKFRPEFNQEYMYLSDGRFNTVNAGGYIAQVLDLEHPSEGLSFGLGMHGKQHLALIVGFRLFPSP